MLRKFLPTSPSGGLHLSTHQVMIGIHVAQAQVICASLNFNDGVTETYVDPAHGNQVPSDPPMHGCHSNFFIQAFLEQGPGLDEALTCVGLQDQNRRPLSASQCTADDNGATQSTIYGFDQPKMHACPPNYAMVGIQQRRNELYCCN
jgi:hypothetical protein